jgi:predicted ATP-grasp superfamily ATP-dependent carboligase
VTGTVARVGVLLDFGAATPLGILAAGRGLCDVVFLCDRRLPYVRTLADGLADLGTVCDITGLSDTVVRQRVDALRLDGLTTFSETQIRRTAELALDGGLAYLSPPAARAVTDKLTQRRLLAAAGLPTPRCRVVSDPADLADALDVVGLPAVLKPRSGAGSAHTCRVDTVADARRRLTEFRAAIGPASRPDFVVEEYLRGDPAVAGPGWGDYVSVESVTVHGIVRHVEVTGKFPLAEPFRETGYVVPSTLDQQYRASVLELTTAAVEALGIRYGVTHVEVKLTPDGPRIIEVNGRLGGYVADLVRRARGVDLIRLVLGAALGRSLDVLPTAYRRYAFQFFLAPPMRSVALRRLDGVAELSRQAGIHLVETFRVPGDRLDWRDGTLSYLGIVHGSAQRHDEVLNLVTTIRRTLAIDCEEAPPAGIDALRTM